MVQNQSVAERQEKIRDLTSEVAELQNQGAAEVIFQEISPRRRPITIYSTTDGEPIQVPEYMVGAALSAVGPEGNPRFTGRKADVPEYKLGDVKCFLHPESPERPMLAEIGLSGATCAAGHLASGHSKRTHAEHRHGREWAAFQEYLNDRKEAKREQRADEQLQATLALAGKAAPTRGECDTCGKTGLKNVGAHKRTAHPEQE